MSNNLVYVDIYQMRQTKQDRVTSRPQRWRWRAKSGDNARVYLREPEHGNRKLRLADNNEPPF